MAELLGVAASIISIIDVLGTCSSSLLELHGQWKDADLTLLDLISQLTSLKTALVRIKEWTETAVEEPHHQLTMDLEASVTCCKFLAIRMDDELS